MQSHFFEVYRLCLLAERLSGLKCAKSTDTLFSLVTLAAFAQDSALSSTCTALQAYAIRRLANCQYISLHVKVRKCCLQWYSGLLPLTPKHDRCDGVDALLLSGICMTLAAPLHSLYSDCQHLQFERQTLFTSWLQLRADTVSVLLVLQVLAQLLPLLLRY